jgi:hypothetical protein
MLMLVGGKGGEAPVNTVAPALSDSTPEYDQTISVSDGTWTSITTPTFTYQWKRGASDISGATSSSYTVVSDDVGQTLRCVVTATNPFGSTLANSNTSSTVVAVAPDQVSTPTAVGGEEQATVTWTELSFPTETGGIALDRYQVLPSPATGGVRNASGSPFTVTGLTGGTAYTFTVRAENSVASGAYSSASNSVTPTSLPIGLFMGGSDSGGSKYATINKITISSTGNATDYGDIVNSISDLTSAASTTRGLAAGGSASGATYANFIDYGTIASSGNWSDFGDLTIGRFQLGGGNNSTRACFFGGIDYYSTSRIDYVTIASTGNATDFGDLADHGYGYGRRYGECISSPTHILYMGGESGYDGQGFSDFQRITTATTGNSSSYGSCAAAFAGYNCGGSSSTRGVYQPSSTSALNFTNTINYNTFSTSGYTGDFGDLLVNTSGMAACSSTTRVTFAGGRIYSGGYSDQNVIQYITISTTGNSSDFGDLVGDRFYLGGCSNDGGGVQ